MVARPGLVKSSQTNLLAPLGRSASLKRLPYPRLMSGEGLRHIPVVAITAFAMKGDEERIRSGGCEAYISKPISVGHFLETVQRFVGEPRA